MKYYLTFLLLVSFSNTKASMLDELCSSSSERKPVYQCRSGDVEMNKDFCVLSSEPNKYSAPNSQIQYYLTIGIKSPQLGSPNESFIYGAITKMGLYEPEFVVSESGSLLSIVETHDSAAFILTTEYTIDKSTLQGQIIKTYENGKVEIETSTCVLAQ